MMGLAVIFLRQKKNVAFSKGVDWNVLHKDYVLHNVMYKDFACRPSDNIQTKIFMYASAAALQITTNKQAKNNAHLLCRGFCASGIRARISWFLCFEGLS